MITLEITIFLFALTFVLALVRCGFRWYEGYNHWVGALTKKPAPPASNWEDYLFSASDYRAAIAIFADMGLFFTANQRFPYTIFLVWIMWLFFESYCARWGEEVAKNDKRASGGAPM